MKTLIPWCPWRVCLGDDEVNGSGVAICYPVLCPVEQVVIALVFRSRTLGGGVAASFGFAKRKAPNIKLSILASLGKRS